MKKFKASGCHSKNTSCTVGHGDPLSGLAEKYGDSSFLAFSKAGEADSRDFTVIPNFISTEEEDNLMMDVSRSLRGKKYQFDHWDGVSTCLDSMT